MTLFPTDILEEIFENLESSISTLHSCLLLSRVCCKAIIPILYRQPFRYTRHNPSPKLIKTYLYNVTSKDLSLILKDDLDLLKRFNIELSDSSNKDSIFNYHSYLKRLNYRDLYDFGLIWYRHIQKQYDINFNDNERYKFLNPTENDPYSQEPMKTLSRILLNFFMIKGAKFDYLLMDSGKELIDNSNEFIDAIKSLREEEGGVDGDQDVNDVNPILKNCLENLKIFGFYGKGKFQGQTLDIISSNCQGLQSLIINLTVNDEWNTARAKKEITSLNNLINNQKVLKDFIYVEYQGKFWWSPSSRLRDIEIDFSHHVHNLLVVEFYDVYFQLWKPLNILASLTNLRELAFVSCKYQESVMAPLKYSSYKKLQKLSMIGWDEITLIDPKVVEVLIENAKDTLRSLSIVLTHKVSTIVLESINKFQPNLVELAIKFDQTHLSTLLHLPFYSFRNLEKLTLNNWGHVAIDVDLILPLLGKSLPQNLKNLQILARWTFSTEGLNRFLNNCEAKLKYIDIRHCTGITEEHIDLIWMKFSDSLERLIIREIEGNDDVPYGQILEANFPASEGLHSINNGSIEANLSEFEEFNVRRPVYIKRIEINPSEDEAYSYVRTDKLRYRWE
ncbi:11832_t:CDS:2 [Funneliformis geosporum]|uniref:6906_t:CDS:1 n=1 Tax=Funneliformis geosporum TaxID=1117311 RepID=A0A9W4WT65_9GLOM|nr:6906_t:CDS:2 [Funneliformis geosporum]CAI2185450.1 11832_t:CDS:2 [Funneliformis geosporum]